MLLEADSTLRGYLLGKKEFLNSEFCHPNSFEAVNVRTGVWCVYMIIHTCLLHFIL